MSMTTVPVGIDPGAPALLGARIRELRLAQVPPVSQLELATRAGLSESLIKKLEEGARDVGRVATLRLLAAALGTDVPALLASAGTPAGPGRAVGAVERSAGRSGPSPGHQGDPSAAPDGHLPDAPGAGTADDPSTEDGDGVRAEPVKDRRTRLAVLLSEWPMTRYEAIMRFNATARALEEDVTVSLRQFDRWANGEGSLPRPAARRVLEAAFGLPASELLALHSDALRQEVARTDSSEIETEQQTGSGPAGGGTVLRALLRERHWQTYSTFCGQYDIAAARVDESLVGTWPSRPQLQRWLSGTMKGTPYPNHCRVLEAMFLGYTARQLFETSAPEDEYEAVTGQPDDSIGRNDSGRQVLNVHDSQFRDDARLSPDYGDKGASEILARSAVESESLLAVVPGIDDFELLQEAVTELGTRYVSSPPLIMLKQSLAIRTELLHRMTGSALSPSQLSDFYMAVGRASGVIAYAALDLGDPHSAAIHSAAVWRIADFADNDELRAWSRGTQSLVARYNEEYTKARLLAEDGIRYSGTAGVPRARLICAAAQCAANQGDAASALELIDEAERSRDHSEDEIVDGIFEFPYAKQKFYAASSLMWSSDKKSLKMAAQNASEAIAIWRRLGSERVLDDEALAYVYLATARMKLGEIDAGMEAIAPVFALPAERRTSWMRKRVAHLREILADDRYKGSLSLADAKQRFHEFEVS